MSTYSLLGWVPLDLYGMNTILQMKTYHRLQLGKGRVDRPICCYQEDYEAIQYTSSS